MKKNKALKSVFGIYTGIFIFVLYAPLIVLTILSFQVGPEGGPQFPLQGFSLYWYEQLFGLTPPSRVAPLDLGDAIFRSLTLAIITMIVSTILGTLTAQAFRKNFKGSGLVFYLILLGIMVPGILVGLGIALVSNTLGIDKNWYSTSFVAHVLYTYPFAFIVMLAIFNRFDRSIEEAAMDLGANELKTFWRITLPQVIPGLLSAALFAFTLSYDEFPRTLFAAGPDLTLPLTIFGTFSIEVHPNLFAFGVLTTLFSFSILILYYFLMMIFTRKPKRLNVQEDIN
ncbi:ABC transporter permease [Ferviditalea candida]|uniref:ABC transporter permease n=1 Tax=Ferviditalea candida TaxID=3108399 RepID=A0ABU5ZL11_9BACL|nr:ABC transporter permease [Paenibacillaceae bacterium T2]